MSQGVSNILGGYWQPPIPMSIIPDLQMLTLVPICGLPIEVADPVTALPTLSYRNTKKPTKTKWLLGKEYPTNIDIQCQRLLTSDVVENEQQKQTMENHMEGLHTNERVSIET